MNLSIDKLTVVGNIFGDLERFYTRCQATEYHGLAKYPYRYSIHFLDGSVLQVAEQERVRSGHLKELRYEFNPNRKEYNKLHYEVLGHMKDVHFTRIDVAFDIYDIDMSSWRWIDLLGRPFNVWYSGTGEVETWYIGGRNSDLRIRIYNKAKEQQKKEKIWWRVEVQMRRETCKIVEEYGGELIYNPFKDIFPVVDDDFKHLDIKTRALVKYLIQHPEGFSELAKASRSKYRKILIEEAKKSRKTIDFASIWEKKHSLLHSELKNWLKLTKVTI